MMTDNDYKKQITELRNEANDIRKSATRHVKAAMSELMKYVRSVGKKSDAIAIKAERLLDKRLAECKDNDKISDSLNDMQMIDIASDIFWHIHKIVEDNADNYDV